MKPKLNTKKALATSVVIALVLYLGSFEVRKAIVDMKVTKLCLEHGGVEIFEHVVLSQEEYDRNGGLNDFISITDKRVTHASHDYVVKSENVSVLSSEPELIKSVYVTHRKKI